MEAQLSWESICLTSRGSQVRALLFPPLIFIARMREWLSGRALPCQGKCREFESRFPLHFFILGLNMAPQPSGKAWACKASTPSSNLGGASINSAAVAEQADARDLKSLGVTSVPVQVRPAAPKSGKSSRFARFFLVFKKISVQNRLSHRSFLGKFHIFYPFFVHFGNFWEPNSGIFTGFQP